MNDNNRLQTDKILLAALPFWTPLIPSQGIAVLKAFLQPHGYKVKTVDAAAESVFLEYYQDYFSLLKKYIPEEKRGNFYNIGHDALRNHLEAYTNREDPQEYAELVRLLIYHTYHTNIEEFQVEELSAVVRKFFLELEKYFLRILTEEKPAVLGLTVNSGNLGPSAFVFQLARRHFPAVKTVMGGPVFFNHLAVGTPDLESFLKRTAPYIDKLIVGKGEALFLKYLQGQLPESGRVVTRDDLSGGEETNPTAKGVNIPDMSDYNLEKYLYLAAAASGSCPNLCSFCNVRFFFGEHKIKDPRQAVAEIRLLQEKHGHNLFFMADSLLNPAITGLAKELLKEDLRVYLDGYLRVDEPSCDIENTLLWRKAGLYRVRIGTESGSQSVLDMMGKNITPGLIRRSISTLARAGIKTTTYWVIGHPGETEEDFRMTLDLVEELKDAIWESECNPFTYYYRGQAAEDEWAGKRYPLYPAHLGDMLHTQTWALHLQPSREEIYERVFRFTRHCVQLGIPNAYSVSDLYKADERWKKLQVNAVPSLIEVAHMAKGYRQGVRIERLKPVENVREDDGDFGF